MTTIAFPRDKSGCGCGQARPRWISLPVAPQAAARIRFLGEENPPKPIPLQGALTWLTDLAEQGTAIGGLEINGPGDPLATLAMTVDILSLLQTHCPGTPLGVTTLGIGLADALDQLVANGLSRVTLLVNAVTSGTAQELYRWIRPGKRNIPLLEGVEVLLEEQIKGIAACRKANIPVGVRITVYEGINDREVGEISRRVCDLGVESVGLVPGAGVTEPDGKLVQPSPEVMKELVKEVAHHCKIVELPESAGQDNGLCAAEAKATLPRPSTERPNVAVLSSNGMDIDLHLGQAIKALIYGPREDGLACLLEARDLPEPGSGDNRWERVGEILQDCFVLLAASAGQRPRDILGRLGLSLLLVEDNVEGTVDVLYGGGKKGKGKKKG